MKKQSQLYKSVDFFKCHKAFHWRYLIKPPGVLALRYLSAIDDLETINSWGQKTATWSNTFRNKNPPYAIKFYRNLLGSSNMQAFMVTHKDRPVCIIEISLAQTHILIEKIPCSPEDGILQYLFDVSAKTNINLAIILELFIEYYMSFQGRGRLILPLREEDLQVNQIAIEIGFVEIARIRLDISSLIIYRYQ
jgi:hypothetical protein